MARADFVIGDVAVPAGQRAQVDIELPGLYTETSVHMPVHVVHGRRDGPTLFVSAAVHGDEILGVEMIRRLLLQPRLKSVRGTLLAIPIVNVFGFHIRSRYLPDRRDLNRSFPGREHGSMAGRLASIFLNEVVRRADFGIDLHTAAIHRENFPQIRADMNLDGLGPLARAFAAPVLIHSAPPESSLRHTAAAQGVPIMVYEAGEALRFDEIAIRIGLRGIISVMRELGMLNFSRTAHKPSALVRSSTWSRAPSSGICRSMVKLGDLVSGGDTLAYLSDAGGQGEEPVVAPFDGIILGRTTLPLAYEGEALFHVGRTRAREMSLLEEHVDAMNDTDEFSSPEIVEEPEIV
jgi:predicted deacylase